MNSQDRSTLEMVAGIIGVFALTESDSFGWRHVMIGLILTLYVLAYFARHKTKYESIVYCATASLVVLLTLGKAIDWLRDTHFRIAVARDAVLAFTWLALLIVVFVVHFVIVSKKDAAHEES